MKSTLIEILARRKDDIQQEIINPTTAGLGKLQRGCVGSWRLSRSSPRRHEERAFLVEEKAHAKV